MKAIDKKTFTINVAIEGLEKRPVEVNYKETTDGIPFYECNIGNKKIQLRKDGKWEQIWGDLSQEAVEELGAAITTKI